VDFIAFAMKICRLAFFFFFFSAFIEDVDKAQPNLDVYFCTATLLRRVRAEQFRRKSTAIETQHPLSVHKEEETRPQFLHSGTIRRKSDK
jgi:hypothetical protein